jgi:hypothetical protein
LARSPSGERCLARNPFSTTTVPAVVNHALLPRLNGDGYYRAKLSPPRRSACSAGTHPSQARTTAAAPYMSHDCARSAPIASRSRPSSSWQCLQRMPRRLSWRCARWSRRTDFQRCSARDYSTRYRTARSSSRRRSRRFASRSTPYCAHVTPSIPAAALRRSAKNASRSRSIVRWWKSGGR